MEARIARIESDIACIKAAVSSCAQRDAHCASLNARIDRINEELRDSRSKIYQLDLFQSAVKGVLSGLAAALVIGLIVALLKAAGSSHSKDALPDKEQPERADVSPSQP
ncbi:MAG: hypothetical protein WDO56_13065 [Gammaproteobacteria bacterium]